MTPPNHALLLFSLEQRAANRWIVGVAIATCGNILISMALSLQKLAHQRLNPSASSHANHLDQVGSQELQGDRVGANERTRLIRKVHQQLSLAAQRSTVGNFALRVPTETKHQSKTCHLAIEMDYLHSPTWWSGMILMSVGELGNFLSYGFAPASLVAPLGTVALISNCVFAKLLLDEQIRRSDFFGVVLAVLGTCTIVLSSPRNSPVAMEPDQLFEAMSQAGFVVYAVVCLGLVLCLGCLSNTDIGASYVLIDVGVCAILGGFTVLSTKAFSSLLNTMLLDCFMYSITWVMLVVMLVTAVIQVMFLNRALQRFDSKNVVPVQFVCFTIMAIVGSVIMYQDFDQVQEAQIWNFIFGCLFIFCGVYILTRKEQDSSRSRTVQDGRGRRYEEEQIGRLPHQDEEEERELGLGFSPRLGLPGGRRADHHQTHRPLAQGISSTKPTVSSSSSKLPSTPTGHLCPPTNDGSDRPSSAVQLPPRRPRSSFGSVAGTGIGPTVASTSATAGANGAL